MANMVLKHRSIIAKNYLIYQENLKRIIPNNSNTQKNSQCNES